MTSNRHEKLGIKQTIQREWMDRTVQMMLAGLSEQEIRTELDSYLSTQKQSGGVGERGKKTYGMAISLLASWFAPSRELRAFRDDALTCAKHRRPEHWLALHWAVITASYPFWFNVAKQTGRLLNLQSKVTQPQIFSRLKEQYGDREVVARNARYTVRSFVAWGVLSDSEALGRYEKCEPVAAVDKELAVLLLESALLATPDAKCSLSALMNNPGFFPFKLPLISGGIISQRSGRIDVLRYGLDDEFLKLKDH